MFKKRHVIKLSTKIYTIYVHFKFEMFEKNIIGLVVKERRKNLIVVDMSIVCIFLASPKMQNTIFVDTERKSMFPFSICISIDTEWNNFEEKNLK